MSSAVSDLIHPSKLGDWAACPKRAYNDLDHGTGLDVETVAQWVGNAAHAVAACLPPVPDPATFMLFDSTTPNAGVGRLQAAMIASIYEEVLASRGLRAVRTELDVGDGVITGTLDALLATDVGKHLVINDMKTGKAIPPGVWLQLGAYFDAYNADHPDAPASSVMVVHIPRGRLVRAPAAQVIERDGAACAAAARVLIEEVKRWMDTCTVETIPATPGAIACAGCPLGVDECAVRIEGRQT